MSAGTRILHQSGFRRGPLSRPVDRLEAWTRLALVFTFLTVTVPVTWYVAASVATAGVQQEAAQRSDRHQVVATLLAADIDRDTRPGLLTIRTPATARWSEPDGSQHQGQVPFPLGSRAGATQLIWTDGAGRPVPAPQERDDTAASVAGAVFFTIVLCGGLTTIAGVESHRRFQQRRFRQWEADWQRVAPDWTGYR